MIKYLILFITVFSFGSNMQILSKSFEYNQAKNMSKFEGDVNVTKGDDKILSQLLYVYMTEHKKLYKLVAIKKVKFKITDKNITYKGSSNKLTYIAPKQLFIFEGKVHITKLPDNQQLYGDKVVIDKLHGTANVIGKENKPLKFIIKVND